MAIFKGQPNLFVTVERPKLGEPRNFFFDEKGYYRTDNPSIIKRLSTQFEEVKAFTCEKCGFEATSAKELKKHIEVSHKEEPNSENIIEKGEAN